MKNTAESPSLNPRSASTNNNAILLLLVAVSAIGPLALNIFIPSMPGLQAAFATDYGTVQLTLTLYLAATALSQLFLGSWSDRFGRRPVLLVGLILFLIGSVAAAAATSIEMLIGSRIVQAVGGCAGLVLGRAIIRDLYDQDNAASKIAYVTMAMVVAPMLAPTIGGFLDVWFGWRASFVALVVFGVLVLLSTLSWLPETHHQRQSSLGNIAMFKNFAILLRTPLFCAYALNMSFAAGIFFAFLAGAPYVMVELLNRSPAEYGVYFIFVSLGYMAGNFAAARLSRRLGIQRMLLISSILAASATVVLAALSLAAILTPWAIFAPMMVVALSNGINLPNSTSGAISVKTEMTGAAAGLSGFMQIATGALATFIVGQLQNDSQWPMVLVMLASALLAGATFVWVVLIKSRSI